MTQNGDPRENAIAERMNGILKTEWILVLRTKYEYTTKSLLRGKKPLLLWAKSLICTIIKDRTRASAILVLCTKYAVYDKKPSAWQETVTFVGKIIDLYNNQRPHQSIGYMVTAEVHKTGMKTERMWKKYYRKREASEMENAAENALIAPYSGETRSGYASASFPRCKTENQNLKQ